MPITLCMIVKNEAAILDRCLRGARRLYDQYVIVDTGSTDDTESVAKAALDGVPGVFCRRPWVGFGPGKTDALRIAKETFGSEGYAFVLDADEIVTGDWPADLDKDRYSVAMKLNESFRYKNARLFNLRLDWRYVGILHEFPVSEGPATEAHLDNVIVTSPRDGARSQNPTKYADDAALLEEALATSDPDEVYPSLRTRYTFYAAKSHRDAGNLEAALRRYRERASMGAGLNREEIYRSRLDAGRLLLRLGRSHEAEQELLAAHHDQPQRAEALRELVGVFAPRLDVLEHAPPVGSLFVETTLSQRLAGERETSASLSLRSGRSDHLSPRSLLPYRFIHEKPLSDVASRAAAAAELPPDHLERIFYAHSGRQTDKWHHYLAIYERHLRRFVGASPRLLEIGVQNGGSFEVWRKWLGPGAVLHGVDIDPTCRDRLPSDVTFHAGSQTNLDLLARIEEGGELDIVIDDGSHVCAHQIASFEALYPRLSARGVYICEDVHSSYWKHAGGGWRRSGTFIEHVKGKIDALHGWYVEEDGDPDETFARSTGGLHVYDSMVVIEKCAEKEEPQRSIAGSRG